jgi:hypothetical protein
MSCVDTFDNRLVKTVRLTDQSCLSEEICYDFMEKEHQWLLNCNEVLPFTRLDKKGSVYKPCETRTL